MGMSKQSNEDALQESVSVSQSVTEGILVLITTLLRFALHTMNLRVTFNHDVVVSDTAYIC